MAIRVINNLRPVHCSGVATHSRWDSCGEWVPARGRRVLGQLPAQGKLYRAPLDAQIAIARKCSEFTRSEHHGIVHRVEGGAVAQMN